MLPAAPPLPDATVMLPFTVRVGVVRFTSPAKVTSAPALDVMVTWPPGAMMALKPDVATVICGAGAAGVFHVPPAATVARSW